MPRAKIYHDPRTDIHFRIDTVKYENALARSVELGYSTFNKYLEHLLDDDLLVQSIEQRKVLLAQIKKEKNHD